LLFAGITTNLQEIIRQICSIRQFNPRKFQLQAIIQLDDIDKGIVTSLSTDSRKSYAQVGAEVGLSTAAVHERVKKLMERGVIECFSLRINAELIGLQLVAFVFLRHDGGTRSREIAPKLTQIAEVQELHSVAGEYDFLLKIRTANARSLEEVLYEIKAIDGVMRTFSTVVLSTEFEARFPAV
jgi:Lrp/AsnC family transcriptional regulator, leucine-responsive regulatory protein